MISLSDYHYLSLLNIVWSSENENFKNDRVVNNLTYTALLKNMAIFNFKLEM